MENNRTSHGDRKLIANPMPARKMAPVIAKNSAVPLLMNNALS